ncbi:MAG: homoserine kinase [Chloroflexota bacterium]
MCDQIKVSVPATSANLGPGFDCLGMALSLHNETIFSKADRLSFEIGGVDARKIPADETNLIFTSALTLFDRLGKRPFPMHIQQQNHIPVGSGLGSSSTAVLAGLMGANGLLGFPLSKKEVLDLAIEMEGHPDNVAPAMYGGLVLSLMHDSGTHIECIDIQPINAVVVLPDFKMLTEEARAILPTAVSRQDAIFNCSRIALLLRAFQTNDYDKLKISMQDRLHQPYRLTLIPGAEEAAEAAYQMGAKGVALSGAGPSLIAFAPNNLPQIGDAMRHAFSKNGLNSRQWCLPMDKQGAEATPITNS